MGGGAQRTMRVFPGPITCGVLRVRLRFAVLALDLGGSICTVGRLAGDALLNGIVRGAGAVAVAVVDARNFEESEPRGGRLVAGVSTLLSPLRRAGSEQRGWRLYTLANFEESEQRAARLVVGGWLVAGDWWLAGGWWVAGGWLVAGG
jgi:hypothetical protein